MDGVIPKRKNKAKQKVVGSNGFKQRSEKNYHVYQLGKSFEPDEYEVDYFDNRKKFERTMYQEHDDLKNDFVDDLENDDEYKKNISFSLKDIKLFGQNSVLLSRAVSVKFLVLIGIVTTILGTFLFVGTSLAVKDQVDGAGRRAINSIKSAVSLLRDKDFEASEKSINDAYDEFLFASNEMDKINSFAKFTSQFIPGASKLASGDHLVEAGKYLTHGVKEFYQIIPVVIESDNVLVSDDHEHISLLALYETFITHARVVHDDLGKAIAHLNKVHLDDVPKEHRDTFLAMKETLPIVDNSLQKSLDSQNAVEELLGANGIRTYLFLFQNNQEMRATGGFIGSYGIVKINNGRIEKIMVDDIFNPDGQLIDRVVPPLPIQKVSADWSLHDSNWFVDFPLSAKKAMDFYERTGGPTVDGVVAITPVMMEKLLTLTGPIDLPQHDTVLTAENFVEVLQSEIEDVDNYQNINSDEENLEEENEKNEDKKNAEEDEIDDEEETTKKQPKKILSDLMPVLIDKLTDIKNPKNIAKLLSIVSDGLKEKHILIYMSSEDVQDIVEANGWSGNVLQTDKDYLSVINTNINGFKTDGVIKETITHTAEIDKEGYITDTVSIKRVHNGGKTGYPWWDRVNSDYMRVYVPQGSQLISVEGQTREINKERLDYDALGYERDSDVVREESSMQIDEDTGTRIYNEFNKTVFANWVYVSPQESVTITYKYRLPFRVDFNSDKDGEFGSYAVIYQKQAGSTNSSIKSKIVLDKSFEEIWYSYDGDDEIMEKDLSVDRYHGTVFRVK